MNLKFNIRKWNKENIRKWFKEAVQMINLIYRNYSDGETQVLSISLTYFSMLAVFPMVALILGITKGFGLDRMFVEKIFELVPQNEEMVRTVLDIAGRLLISTEGSILTGIGIVILLASSVKVLMVLENSFNKIWHVSKNRSITRRIVDCVAIIFLGPIFLLVIAATNSFVIEKMSSFFLGKTVVLNIFLQMIGPLSFVFFFALLFYIIPNTNVKLKPAIISGAITAILCYVLKVAFLFLQSSITKYNAIYGSLAFIPIFLIWVQYIWVTVLLGAQIAFSIQNSDEFLYNEKVEMPIQLKKEAGLLISTLIIKRFKANETPYTYLELSKRLGMEVLFVKDILSELEKMGFINEVLIDKNDENRYQVAYDPEIFTISSFVEKIEGKNAGYYSNIFDNLKDEDRVILEKIRENTISRNGTLLKNIVLSQDRKNEIVLEDQKWKF